MSHLFRFLSDRKPLTFKEALPRTAASIAAATSAQSGFIAGATFGALIGAFAMDDPKATEGTALTLMGTTAIATTIIAAVAGYATGYGGSNLFMNAFPAVKNMESRFLLSPGIKPQFCLFMGTLLLPVAIKALELCMTETSNHTSRALKM